MELQKNQIDMINVIEALEEEIGQFQIDNKQQSKHDIL